MDVAKVHFVIKKIDLTLIWSRQNRIIHVMF